MVSSTGAATPWHASQPMEERVSADAQSVVVLGPPAACDPVLRVLVDHPAEVTQAVHPTAPGLTPSVWVCTSAAALRAVVEADSAAPLIITDAVVPTAVSPAAVPALIDAWTAGEARVHTLASHAVTIDGVDHKMLLEVVISTDAVAQISEFAVTHRSQLLHEVRADGVTVAAPVGSGGYAHAIGGPRLGAVTGLVVVPMAAFASHTSVWVTPAPVSVRLMREEAVVSACIDGVETVPLDPSTRLTVAAVGSYDVIGQW